MKTVIVTPAGRKGYLELLVAHVRAQKQDFDEWHLWLNTLNQEDIAYCKELAQTYSWIKTYDLEVPHQGNLSIYSFFKYAKDLDTVYIRLDDDIIYLEPGFVSKLKTYRVANPEPTFVYPVIINNNFICGTLSNYDRIDRALGIDEACMGSLWSRPDLAQQVHELFLSKVSEGRVDHFHIPDRVMSNYERVSINCISWLGETMHSIDGNVGRDEEHFLSCDFPRDRSKPNVVYGGTVCSHFSYYTQRHHLECNTDILNRYLKLCPS